MPGSQPEVFARDAKAEVKVDPKREPMRSFVAQDQMRKPAVVETDADREAAVAAIKEQLNSITVNRDAERLIEGGLNQTAEVFGAGNEVWESLLPCRFGEPLHLFSRLMLQHGLRQAR